LTAFAFMVSLLGVKNGNVDEPGVGVSIEEVGNVLNHHPLAIFPPLYSVDEFDEHDTLLNNVQSLFIINL